MARLDTAALERADRRFIRQATRGPLLSREHEQELAIRWRDHQDEAALHELVLAYSRLVISFAARFRNYGLPMADLIQEGTIGLMQAAARFEPEREFRFSTYAAWWIRSAMQDYILRNWSIVRTGTTAAQKSLFFNFRRLRARIDSKTGGTLGMEGRAQIAHALKVSVHDVESMEGRLSFSDQSLNAVVGENGDDEWLAFIPDDKPHPEDAMMAHDEARTRHDWLSEALSELSAREQQIIRERRLSEEAVTLEELGKELGISKERVRQIEHKALEKMRLSMLRSRARDDTPKAPSGAPA
jgi:RNA polymerase sigma-32 factor